MKSFTVTLLAIVSIAAVCGHPVEPLEDFDEDTSKLIDSGEKENLHYSYDYMDFNDTIVVNDEFKLGNETLNLYDDRYNHEYIDEVNSEPNDLNGDSEPFELGKETREIGTISDNKNNNESNGEVNIEPHDYIEDRAFDTDVDRSGPNESDIDGEPCDIWGEERWNLYDDRYNNEYIGEVKSKANDFNGDSKPFELDKETRTLYDDRDSNESNGEVNIEPHDGDMAFDTDVDNSVPNDSDIEREPFDIDREPFASLDEIWMFKRVYGDKDSLVDEFVGEDSTETSDSESDSSETDFSGVINILFDDYNDDIVEALENWDDCEIDGFHTFNATTVEDCNELMKGHFQGTLQIKYKVSVSRNPENMKKCLSTSLAALVKCYTTGSLEMSN